MYNFTNIQFTTHTAYQELQKSRVWRIVRFSIIKLSYHSNLSLCPFHCFHHFKTRHLRFQIILMCEANEVAVYEIPSECSYDSQNFSSNQTMWYILSILCLKYIYTLRKQKGSWQIYSAFGHLPHDRLMHKQRTLICVCGNW